VNKKLLTTLCVVLAVLCGVASVVMFIMNIWIPDIRWAQTGGIFLTTGVALGFAAGGVNI
jgi:ABC-type sulfate transport system permease subunit